MDTLNKNQILNFIKESDVKKSLHRFLVPEIDIFDCVNSTNDVCMRYAKNHIYDIKNNTNNIYVAISESQSSGRGRLGRSFFSPSGTGIYMSILLRKSMLNPLFNNKLHALTPVTALCLSEAIEKTLITKLSNKMKPKIKWVNDIYMNNHKVAGILTELYSPISDSSISTGEPYIIIGIGINVYEPIEGFPDDIRNKAGSILKKTEENFRNKLISNIFCEISKSLLTGKTDIKTADTQLANFVLEYKKRCFVLGKNVTFNLHGVNEMARAVDINQDFELIVQSPDGEFNSLNCGDVIILS